MNPDLRIIGYIVVESIHGGQHPDGDALRIPHDPGKVAVIFADEREAIRCRDEWRETEKRVAGDPAYVYARWTRSYTTAPVMMPESGWIPSGYPAQPGQ